ncbi:hypothetical protein DMUE_3402 [Dictyocoela muelleri]|nr:hypothetical protein DMUE_3402 [Dictyocoela muelleri]
MNSRFSDENITLSSTKNGFDESKSNENSDKSGNLNIKLDEGLKTITKEENNKYFIKSISGKEITKKSIENKEKELINLKKLHDMTNILNKIKSENYKYNEGLDINFKNSKGNCYKRRNLKYFKFFNSLSTIKESSLENI